MGFCFIGGLTVLRWGEPRVTQDIDLTIMAAFGDESPVVDGYRDWLDLEGIVVRQGEALDGGLVLRELAPLAELKGSNDALDRLQALLDAEKR